MQRPLVLWRHWVGLSSLSDTSSEAAKPLQVAVTVYTGRGHSLGPGDGVTLPLPPQPTSLFSCLQGHVAWIFLPSLSKPPLVLHFHRARHTPGALKVHTNILALMTIWLPFLVKCAWVSSALANVRRRVLQSLPKCHSAHSSLDAKSLKCLITQRKLIIKCLSEKKKAKKYAPLWFKNLLKKRKKQSQRFTVRFLEFNYLMMYFFLDQPQFWKLKGELLKIERYKLRLLFFCQNLHG